MLLVHQEGLAVCQRTSLRDFLDNQWYMSIIPATSSSSSGLAQLALLEGLTAGALRRCFENSILVTHLLSSQQFWQGRKWGSTVQRGISTWSPLCSFVARTKTSAAIASWRQPPGTLTSKAWTPWLPTYFTCGPELQQGTETSAAHSSSQLTQVTTCPLLSLPSPWAKRADETELRGGSFSLAAGTVLCLFREDVVPWPQDFHGHQSDPRHLFRYAVF